MNNFSMFPKCILCYRLASSASYSGQAERWVFVYLSLWVFVQAVCLKCICYYACVLCNLYVFVDHLSMLIPGNAAGVAKQFLRCVLHQLAPNGILPQLFQSNIKGNQTSAHADSQHTRNTFLCTQNTLT